MIENKIDELIAAINASNETMRALGESLRASYANPQMALYVQAAEKTKPEPKVEPTPTEAPEPAAPKAQSVADKVADIENRCRALTRKDPKTMRVVIMELLEGYGSKTIKGVPENKLDELSDKLTELEG